jgi:hypothetical protein
VKLRRSALLAVASALALCGCGGRAAFTDGGTGIGGLVAPARFAPADLGRMEIVSLPVRAGFEPRSVLAGDVTAGPEPEIVVLGRSSVAVTDVRGALVQEIPLGKRDVGLGFLADLDGDGKADIVCGGRGEAGGLIQVWNGLGAALMNASFASMVLGDTYPRFALGSTIYFAAYSAYRVAPKLAGAIAFGAESPTWLSPFGPVPAEVTASRDGRTLCVSGQSVPSERSDTPVSYDTDRRQNAVFLLGAASGRRALDFPVGAPSPDVGFAAGQLSGFSARLFDLDQDGADEILLLGERISELYPGPANFEVRNAQGKLLRSMEGPPRTGGSFGFWRRGKSSTVAIAWAHAGTVVTVGADLRTLRSRDLPGAAHDAVIRAVADVNGDGAPEIVVSDADRLHVLGPDLVPLASWALPAPVREVRLVSAEGGKAAFVVLADALYLIRSATRAAGTIVATSVPAGATILLDGREVPAPSLPTIANVPAGRHTLEARIGERSGGTLEVDVGAGKLLIETVPVPLPAGRAAPRSFGMPQPVPAPGVPLSGYASLGLLRTGPVPSGFSLVAVDDLAGDDRPELLFVDGSRLRWALLDAGLHEVLRRGAGPRDGTRFAASADFDGDGKSEIVLTSASGGLLAFEVYAADGRLIASRPVMYGLDASISFGGWTGESALFAVNSGYMLRPRGLLTYRPGADEIGLFYAKAGGFAGVASDGERIIVAQTTVGNGARIDRPDGRQDTDSAFFVHFITLDGADLPGSGPMTHADNRGGLQGFFWDADGDGTREPYLLEDKNAQYYGGLNRIWRIEPDGRRTEMYVGPKDDVGNVYALEGPGGRRSLLVFWVRSGRLDTIRPDWSTSSSIRLPPGTSLYGPMDLDADGVAEILVADGERLAVLGSDLRPLFRFPAAPGAFSGLAIADIDRSGKLAIVLIRGDTIEVYGY